MTYEQFLAKNPPSCPHGFTQRDLELYFGASEGAEHPLWKTLAGQTGSVCDGKEWDAASKSYHPSACAKSPHGFITYTHDVYRWQVGLPNLD